MPARVPVPEGAPTAAIRNLEDIIALAAANNAPILKVALENYIHLVHLEPGRIEFRPHPRAPRTLARLGLAPLEVDALVDRQAEQVPAQAIEGEFGRADADPVATAD